MNHQLANRRISSTASEPHSSRAPHNFGGGDQLQGNDNDGRDYKLIIDPALGQGKDKVIRYNGCMPGRDLVPVGVVDPRPRISRYSLSRHSVNLKIPDFQVDQNYVGKILPKEVTLTNLNNNINVSFLQDMCKAFGDIKTSVIFYHPKTKKHLGVAQVVFSTARAAQRCIEKLNETSKMGNIIRVFADPSGDERRRLLDELMTDDKVIFFRPPSPKLQLPPNIMDEIRVLAPPSASSSSSSSSSVIPIRSNGVVVGPSTSRTASSPATDTTTLYSDRDLRGRSHSNGTPFPFGRRGDSAFPGRADPASVRRQSAGAPVQPMTSDDAAAPAFYPQQQVSEGASWNQPQQTKGFNQSKSTSAVHESNSHCSEGARERERPNWRRSNSERNNPTVRHQTNELDGYGPENQCEGKFNEAYPQSDRLGLETSKEGFQLGRQPNAGSSSALHRQVHQDAFRATDSPANLITSQNSQDGLGQMNNVVSFAPLSSRLDEQPRAFDSPDETTNSSSQLSMAGKISELQNKKSVNNQGTLETIDPRTLKDRDSRDPRQQRHEDQTNRQTLATDRHDFRKSSSRDATEVCHESKRGSRRHDGSRHRNHDSSHGRRRSRHKRHRSHRRHRSSSNESGSKMTVSRDLNDHHGSSASILPNSLPTQALSAPSLPTLPSDCLPFPSNNVFPSSSSAVDPSLSHPSLESRIQQLLGQQDERNSINGFSGLVFPPPPLPPPPREQPPPPPPAELPPLPPEPAPLDGAGDVSMGQGEVPPCPTGGNNSMFTNHSEATNYVYNSSVNGKAGQMEAGSMSRHAASLPGTRFNDDGSVEIGHHHQTTTSVDIISSDPFRSELQYPPPPLPPPFWYAPYPPPPITQVNNIDNRGYGNHPHDNGLYGNHPLDNDLYGNHPLDNGLYGNHPFDSALYSMAALYGGAFGQPPIEEGVGNEGGNFALILEELVTELKKVMVRDMQKKMVENIGFKVYENWWKKEEDKEKIPTVLHKPIVEGIKSKLESSKRPVVQTTNLTPLLLTSAPSTSDLITLAPPLTSSAPTKALDSNGSSSLLWSLFDSSSKDGGGGAVGRGGCFGGGGLLGLRGAVAKMPSFRKKCPSPLPERERDDDDEDDDEDDDDDDEEEEEEEEAMTFRGPRTPEESENEDDDDDDDDDETSSSSLGEEDLAHSVKLLQRARPSKAFLYSSTSNSESGDDEDAEDGVRREDEKEDERVSEGGGGGDDDLMTGEEDEEDAEEESNDQSDAEAAVDAPLRTDERLKRQKTTRRPLMLSSDDDDDDDEGVVVIATQPDAADGGVGAAEEKRGIAITAESSPSLPLLSPPPPPPLAAAVSYSHLIDDRRTPVVVINASSTVLPTPHPPPSLKSESLPLEENSEREKETQREDEKRERHEGSVKSVAPSQDNKTDLESLPVIKASHLVDEWLSALRLDHAYSLSPALHSKKGRKPRVQWSKRDDDLSVDLSDDTVSLSDSAIGLTATLPSSIALDHGYCHPFFPVHDQRVSSDSDEGEFPPVDPLPIRIVTDSGEVLKTEDVPNILMEVEVVEERGLEEEEVPVARKRKRLSDVTNFPGSRELANILPPVVRKPEYVARGEKEEREVLEEYVRKGLDAEDMAFLKRQYDELVQEDYPRTYWVNETHWVNHPPTFELSPPRKRSRTSRNHDVIDSHHATGSARTEGYYKISRQAKSLYLRHTRGVDDNDDDALDDDQRRCLTDEVARKKSQQSRDVRSESRRWQNLFVTDLGDDLGDILKFNKLEIRKKQLKFARSRIHDWGLFAKEPIGEGEMVIEYVGEVVRRSVADALEKRYEALGIGSSYLFRVDHNVIIDATKHGNLSRFINHSCSPNCYAKVITVDSEKKIVIYSKRDIQINDEITYDYKFPLEDEKIPCLCGTSGCRGTLN